MVVLSDISEKEEVLKLREVSNYKSKLMASVSHEIRSPLGTSIGMI